MRKGFKYLGCLLKSKINGKFLPANEKSFLHRSLKWVTKRIFKLLSSFIEANKDFDFVFSINKSLKNV
jgi:hypothetical protein